MSMCDATHYDVLVFLFFWNNRTFAFDFINNIAVIIIFYCYYLLTYFVVIIILYCYYLLSYIYYYVALHFMTHFRYPAHYCSGLCLISTVNTVNKKIIFIIIVFTKSASR